MRNFNNKIIILSKTTKMKNEEKHDFISGNYRTTRININPWIIIIIIIIDYNSVIIIQ